MMLGFVDGCDRGGVEVKWFGDNEPRGFTSRDDGWHSIYQSSDLTGTREVLST